jgi:ribonuclease HI
MRNSWALPEEKELCHSGHEWILQIIDKANEEMASKLLLLLWRVWFIRNELTHSTRKLSIVRSVGFLQHYWETLCSIRQEGGADDKGKKAMFPEKTRKAGQGEKQTQTWEPPDAGKIKINVDGAFDADGKASFGVVIRNESGRVILSAWGEIRDAVSAEETEHVACREGVKLAAQWSLLLTILESDCSTVINFLMSPDVQRSQSAFTISETRQAAEGLPSIKFKHVGREQNRVAHELAQLGRRLSHNAVWNDRGPVCVEQLVAQECNHVFE